MRSYDLATSTVCNTTHSFIYPMLYHDIHRKYMLRLELSDEGAEKYSTILKSLNCDLPGLTDFPVEMSLLPVQEYRFRIARDPNTLLEKIRIFDANLDDRIIELLKLLYKQILCETKLGLEISNILFAIQDSRQEFLLINDDEVMGEVDIDWDSYSWIRDNLADRIEKNSSDTYIFDATWAARL